MDPLLEEELVELARFGLDLGLGLVVEDGFCLDDLEEDFGDFDPDPDPDRGGARCSGLVEAPDALFGDTVTDPVSGSVSFSEEDDFCAAFHNNSASQDSAVKKTMTCVPSDKSLARRCGYMGG